VLVDFTTSIDLEPEFSPVYRQLHLLASSMRVKILVLFISMLTAVLGNLDGAVEVPCDPDTESCVDILGQADQGVNVMQQRMQPSKKLGPVVLQEDDED